MGKGLCMMIRFLTSHVALASMSREVVEVVPRLPKETRKSAVDLGVSAVLKMFEATIGILAWGFPSYTFGHWMSLDRPGPPGHARPPEPQAAKVAGIVVTLLLFLAVAGIAVWQVSNGLGQDPEPKAVKLPVLGRDSPFL